MNQPIFDTIRVYPEIRIAAGKKDPSKQHGFQTIGIVKSEGRIEETEMYFDPVLAQHFLPPGDYKVVAAGLFIDNDGRLLLRREYVPVPKGAKN